MTNGVTLALTGVTPLGATAPTTLSQGLGTLTTAIGTSGLTGITPLGATAPTTLQGGLTTLTTAIGTGSITNLGSSVAGVIGNIALTSVGGGTAASSLSDGLSKVNTYVGGVLASANLRGGGSAIPATLKIAIDNIDATIGSGQLLEYGSGAGTLSGVIGVVATGLLGVGGKTIAGAIGNTILTTTDPTLSGAIAEINASGWVTSAKILDGTIVSADLSSTAGITSGQILDGTIVSADLSSTAGITSGQILDGTIVNADISTGAAIAYSKLSLTGNIVSADLSSTAGITGGQIADATITTANLLNSAVTNIKQGFGTWKVTGGGVDSWTGNVDDLSGVPITGCTNASGIGDTTHYYSVVLAAPIDGTHVDFADYLAISGQCAEHCATQTGLSNCLNHFFTFV